MRTWGYCIAFSLCLVSIALAADVPEPVMVPNTGGPGFAQTDQGSARVVPGSGIAGQFGTWTVEYTVGEKGIQQGGGIRVQLPDAWHAGPRNSATKLQTNDPKGNNYLTAHTSRDGVRVQTVIEDFRDTFLIKHAKLSLDGRMERYVFVVRVYVEQGNLQPGDTVSVVYGDTSSGSAGYRAAIISTGPLPILIAVDEDGDSKFLMHRESPTITSKPGSAVDMMVHLPSQTAVGDRITGLISLVDAEANPVHHSVTVDLEGDRTLAEFPKTVTVPTGQGYVEFPIEIKEDGVVWITGRTKVFELETRSNPMKITSQPPDRYIYWGDLHSHTDYSWDGVGQQQFDYARYTSGLDFYARTDHSRTLSPQGYSRGLNPNSWDAYCAMAERYNDPPHFVTLHAYECSFGKPYGHHNVFFRGKPGALIAPEDSTLQQLWDALKAGDALTIPHHTGKFPNGVDFSIHNAEKRRNFEIYSAHGLSEVYDPTNPLSFEHSLFTSDAKSLTTPTYIQDVWKRGLHLSTVAASDDHRAHPGQPNYGLTAVRASAKTRDAIFQGLYDRATYGTTGAKIFLSFVALNKDADYSFHHEVIGTDTIELIQLVCWQPGEPSFSVVQTWHPSGMHSSDAIDVKNPKAGSIYYLRVKQKNTIRGRAVMAWSSPIWVGEK